MTLDPDLVQHYADAHAGAGRFLGGPPDTYAVSGRRVLRLCIDHGLTPDSTVVEVGCGALRAGVWLIDYLEPDRYYGIEPCEAYRNTGTAILDELGVLGKRPRFDTNDRFDLSVFGVTPDVVVASGIFNHAAKRQIAALFRSFAIVAHPRSQLLASVRLASSVKADYQGDHWEGRSHEREEPGTVRHRRQWLAAAASFRGLDLVDLGQHDNKGPRWLRVTPV